MWSIIDNSRADSGKWFLLTRLNIVDFRNGSKSLTTIEYEIKISIFQIYGDSKEGLLCCDISPKNIAQFWSRRRLRLMWKPPPHCTTTTGQ